MQRSSKQLASHNSSNESYSLPASVFYGNGVPFVIGGRHILKELHHSRRSAYIKAVLGTDWLCVCALVLSSQAIRIQAAFRGHLCRMRFSQSLFANVCTFLHLLEEKSL